ncbi:MAG: helix-turn-helix domain-containing protein, partial [Deinococcales bacterium]
MAKLDVVPPDPELLLTLDASSAEGRAVLKALASEPRTRILEVLSERLLNVSEIAEALSIPLSTATLHVNVLEEAGLLRADLRPGERGLQKVCQRVYDQVLIRLPGHEREPEQQIVELTMPVGAYVRSDVEPTCGLASEESVIGFNDDPTSFFEPEHVGAQLERRERVVDAERRGDHRAERADGGLRPGAVVGCQPSGDGQVSPTGGGVRRGGGGPGGHREEVGSGQLVRDPGAAHAEGGPLGGHEPGPVPA